jgi:hypothetical protein
MSRDDRNLLRSRSGLLPRGILEVGLDDDGVTAWCTYRDHEDPIALIDLDETDPVGALTLDLVGEHRFVPLLALAAARQLVSEHRRRNTRH